MNDITKPLSALILKLKRNVDTTAGQQMWRWTVGLVGQHVDQAFG